MIGYNGYRPTMSGQPMQRPGLPGGTPPTAFPGQGAPVAGAPPGQGRFNPQTFDAMGLLRQHFPQRFGGPVQGNVPEGMPFGDPSQPYGPGQFGPRPGVTGDPRPPWMVGGPGQPRYPSMPVVNDVNMPQMQTAQAAALRRY